MSSLASVDAPFPCGMDVLPATYSNGSGWGNVPPEVSPPTPWVRSHASISVNCICRCACFHHSSSHQCLLRMTHRRGWHCVVAACSGRSVGEPCGLRRGPVQLPGGKRDDGGHESDARQCFAGSAGADRCGVQVRIDDHGNHRVSRHASMLHNTKERGE